MSSSWRHKLSSILAEVVGLDFLFDFSGSVGRMETIVAFVAALLPTLGLAMIIPGAIWIYWSWWPTVRRVFPRWRLYELVPEIEYQMDALAPLGYDPKKFHHHGKK